MHGPSVLLAPLALLLPMPLAEPDQPALANDQTSTPQPVNAAQAGRGWPTGVDALSLMRQSDTAQQIRIEQRVVIRISPQPQTARNLLADLPQRSLPTRFEERGKENCVPLQGIAGVQTGSGNRLVLFLRDARMLSLNLEKSCRARDFYSGFYVEKSRDGRLCVERDMLQSRSGARCEVETMRQLVEVRG